VIVVAFHDVSTDLREVTVVFTLLLEHAIELEAQFLVSFQPATCGVLGLE
jgi:hypothetical protein